MSVKEIINKYIVSHGITKAELAAKAGLAAQVISDLCAERRRDRKVIARKLMQATEMRSVLKICGLICLTFCCPPEGIDSIKARTLIRAYSMVNREIIIEPEINKKSAKIIKI